MKFIRPSTILDTGAFTRASTATFVGSNGLIQSASNNVPRINYDPVTLACKGYLGEAAATNLLTYSEQFDNAAWGKSQSGAGVAPVVTANAAPAPDGTTTADRVVFVAPVSGDGSTIGRSPVTSAGSHAGTFYIRASAAVDVGKVIGFRHVGASSYTLVTLTDAWSRVEVVETRLADNFEISLRPAVGTSSGTVSVLLWGAQLEAGASATSYIPTTTAAVTRAADTITGAGLVYCNIPETDFPAWVSGTSYALNDKVIRTSTHSIYQRAVAGAGTTPPETDTTNWVRIGPTNRWAPFDAKVGTVATNTGTITYILKPGRLNGLALLGVVAGKATVALVVNNETVYTATLDLDSGNTVGNWYEYFYEPIYQQGEVVITDLLDAALFDVPGYSEGILSVTLERPTETVSCGMLVVGIASDIGLTQYGARVSVRDYSKKDADSFGNYTLTVGDFSKRMTADVIVDNGKLDNVVNYLTRYRATNLVWVGSSVYGCTVVYGFLADWSVQIENSSQSRLSQEIEGMT